MKIWYYGIPAGIYTINQLMQMSGQSYSCVYNTIARLGVCSTRPLVRFKNTKAWIWLGYEYYLKDSKND